MKKKFTPTRLLLAATIATPVIILAAWLYPSIYQSIYPSSGPASVANEEKTPENFPRLLEDSIDCAALMAVMESSRSGRLEPASAIFSLVGYTLGKAQEYAQSGSLPADRVKPDYDRKVIAYYRLFSSQPEKAQSEYRQQFDRCVATARHYDPHTMIQAAYEERQKKQPE